MMGCDQDQVQDQDQDLDLDPEDPTGVRTVRWSLSQEVFGLQGAPRLHFSNREYYRRLEELKRAHRRNMAELEALPGPTKRASCRPGPTKRTSCRPGPRLWEASSGPRGAPPRGTGVRWRSGATEPKPFRMTLREEERRRRQVRTRSAVELENALLRRQLQELQERHKEFRAAPAPAHTRLPLYGTVSRSRGGGVGGDVRSHRAAPPTPFRFLERERRKREAQLAAELQGPEEEEEARRRRASFRARPVPSSSSPVWWNSEDARLPHRIQSNTLIIIIIIIIGTMRTKRRNTGRRQTVCWFRRGHKKLMSSRVLHQSVSISLANDSNEATVSFNN
ncbi:Protein FAM161A [Liparis tanakae]|uniref:Protein FAM161A n=1 Tax=Liparis tanakae TaxID=230148 RepID=A0A4Z2FXY0_9TELE|nr:Protein FAM161A [Liparis tanakae]